MSETARTLLLAELQTLRVVCKHCKAAAEMPLFLLDRQTQHPDGHRDVCCPGCGLVIRPGVAPGHPPRLDAFDHLVQAWQVLSPPGGNFTFQLVVGKEEPPKTP